MKVAMVLYEAKDRNYLPLIRALLGKYGISRIVASSNPIYPEAINIYASQYKADYIFIANMQTVDNIVSGEFSANKRHTIDPEVWAGTVFTWEDGLDKPAMVMLPLRYWHAKPWGQHVMEQHIRKVTQGDWGNGIYNLRNSDSIYASIDGDTAPLALAELEQAELIAIDIETVNHIRMDMVGYCARFKDGSVKAYIVDMGNGPSIEQMDFIRKANMTSPVKVFHNGCYDNQFFLRYQAPVNNYILDTEYLFYAMYSELPASLAFVAGYFSPVARYWKHMAGKDRAKYCALDCFNTLIACECMLKDYPEYAVVNYAKVFSTVAPLLWCAMHGIRIDTVALEKAKSMAQAALDTEQKKLNIMCGGIEFNVCSPTQVKALLYDVLGARKVKVRGVTGGTDETTLAKLSEQHPIIRRYCDAIISIRGNRKALSTYYTAALFNGRLLYSYRPDGTDTGRLACKKSSFGWSNKDSDNYGAQAQNIPSYMKTSTVSDRGYTLGEADKSQSEARCTAYIANDRKLIASLECGDDFYITCAMLFFGVAKSEAKKLRQLTKKIIHGSNYMMGADTFIDSVRKDFGTGILTEAQAILKRNPSETLKSFATYLLALYRQTYDRLPPWYDETRVTLLKTGRIVGPRGWTRVVFGDPRSDNTLRSIVAHQPQNLSVDIINEALVRVFWDIQVRSNGEFKLVCQVHDSIVYQCIEGKEEEYQKLVQAAMDIKVTFPTFPEHPMSIPTSGAYGKTWLECHT